MTDFDDRSPRHDVVGRRVAGDGAHKGEFTYVVVEHVRPGGERRGNRRARSHLREGVLTDGRKTVAECRVRELSKGGARLHLDTDQPLPKLFLLTESGTRKCYRATLAWQAGRDAGVKLVALDDLA